MSSVVVAPLLLAPQQAHSLSLNKNTTFLDASWFMPNSPRLPRQEFIAKRIPGAQFLDLDDVASSHELGLKHMMPQEHVFADACGKFGIERDTHVVIYDSHGVFSSPRALFMFRTFGHEKSSVLDGGLPAWLAGGFPIETGAMSPVAPKKYETPSLQVAALRTYEQMVVNSDKPLLIPPVASDPVDLVLDARSRGRYDGVDPEPRAGLPSGHIPNSLSLPFNLFLQSTSGVDGITYTTIRLKDDIRKALEDAVGSKRAALIVDGSIPVTTSCGSGMTAGVLWLGLKILGVERISLYDESWTGYAARPSSKIEKSVTQ